MSAWTAAWLTLIIVGCGLAPAIGHGAPLLQDHDHVVRFRPLSGSIAQDGRGDASLVFRVAPEGTVVSASFEFENLRTNTTYTVVINGQVDDGLPYRATWPFTTNAAGRAVGEATLDGLAGYTSSTVRLGNETGTVILTGS